MFPAPVLSRRAGGGSPRSEHAISLNHDEPNPQTMVGENTHMPCDSEILSCSIWMTCMIISARRRQK